MQKRGATNDSISVVLSDNGTNDNNFQSSLGYLVSESQENLNVSEIVLIGDSEVSNELDDDRDGK